MTERRLVDAIEAGAREMLRAARVDERTTQLLVGEMMRKLREEFGGERHHVHAITTQERARMMALDPRPPTEVARDHGVAVSTVYRARSRRQISNGVR